MNICVRGPLLSISGYGNHTRQVYRWISETTDHKVNTQILPWGITPWHINPNAENGLIGKIMSESVDIKVDNKYDVSFQVQLPNEWDPNLANFNVGVTAAVETDVCNPHWVQCCNRMNLIVVPSIHTKDTLERSGTLTTSIIVIPESFPDAFLQDDLQEFELPNLRTDFNFLIFGQLTGNNAYSDRKNTFFALKWIMEEFSGDSSVGIVLKTNNGRNTSIDRKLVKNMLIKVVREINSDVPVYLLHGTLTDQEIAGLYLNKKIKALVAPTRGEGYGLPLLESATMGLPVIATNWSGHKDFLDCGKWIKLDYKLQEIPENKVDGSIFIKGAKWAEVDEKDFKKKLKKFRNNNQKPLEWARDISSTLKDSHSFSSISKIWQGVIQERLR
jgi:hypothetical protein